MNENETKECLADLAQTAKLADAIGDTDGYDLIHDTINVGLGALDLLARRRQNEGQS